MSYLVIPPLYTRDLRALADGTVRTTRETEVLILRAAARIAGKYNEGMSQELLVETANSIEASGGQPKAAVQDIQDIRDDFAVRSEADDLRAIQTFIDDQSRKQREGLMGRINEVPDGMPTGSFVAVSPPDYSPVGSSTVSVSYTLRPLMAGMPVPDGWIAYGRRDRP